jgi:cytochrome c oxidase assembly protein Cox11
MTTQSHRWKWIAVIAALLLVAAAGILLWRFTAPVEVQIVADAEGLPLEIETFPPVVYARPGEMVKVVYRIHNTDLYPLSAYGDVQIEPTADSSQMEIFRTSCAGLITYQQSYAEDFEVLFRVQPAGLTGTQKMTLRHVFTNASP